MLLLPFMTSYHLFHYHFPMLFQFREILFVDETTGEKAFFMYQSDDVLVPAENYGTKLPALWSGGGVADTDYEYQLLICDAAFLSGFFISGFTDNCFKRCANWCGDNASPSFRSATSTNSYPGVAFIENGHIPLTKKVISVGIR